MSDDACSASLSRHASAPAARHAPTFAAPRATATTTAPSAFAICTAARPTPPPAPSTSTRVPGPTRARAAPAPCTPCRTRWGTTTRRLGKSPRGRRTRTRRVGHDQLLRHGAAPDDRPGDHLPDPERPALLELGPELEHGPAELAAGRERQRGLLLVQVAHEQAVREVERGADDADPDAPRGDASRGGTSSTPSTPPSARDFVGSPHSRHTSARMPSRSPSSDASWGGVVVVLYF